MAGFGGSEAPCRAHETLSPLALAEAVAEAVGTRCTACLMANHGAIAFGADLESAYGRIEKLEVLAQQYALARAVGDEVQLLTEAEMRDVARAYSANAYGRPQRTPDQTAPGAA